MCYEVKLSNCFNKFYSCLFSFNCHGCYILFHSFGIINFNTKKNLSISLNSFINYIKIFSQNLDNSFFQIYSHQKKSPEIESLDLVLLVDNDKLVPIFTSEKIRFNSDKISTKELKSLYSNLYLKKTQVDGKTFLYGNLIDEDFLSNISQKINADIVLFSDQVIFDVSQPQINEDFFFIFLNAFQTLKNLKNFDIFSEESDLSNLLATLYKPADIDEYFSNISFLIFNQSEEYVKLKDSLKNLLIIIGIVGVGLSIILSYILTTKIRRQINKLLSATESIREGNFNVRLDIEGNDELTHLAETFNLMVEKISKNQKILQDYSDFITLINQKSSFKEISQVALNKIISTCNFSIGAIYNVEGNQIQLLSSYGLNNSSFNSNDKTILNEVLEKKSKIIINFNENIPSIKTGLFEVKLNHLIILPIIYSDKVVAILELVSQSSLNDEIVDYLEKIQEQLAIGLINAKSVQQLENYVNDLKKLYEDLEKSNLQVVKQNEMLIKLSEAIQNQSKELSIQKERAEESAKIKSEFLAKISHELKTPLNSIIGLTELIISKSNINDKDKERLKVIQRSGRRLIDLINNLLDYSQIESGKLKLTYSEFSLSDFMDEIVSEIEPLVAKKNLSLFVNKNFNEEIKIYSDKSKLHQVIINLLSNSIKFTDRGFIDLSISIDNNYLNFIVSDSGIGISEEDKKIIFEEFRQVDGSLSRRYEGTGLGLSISKKIVDLMGGEIWFESEINVGSKFYVKIPLDNTQNNFKQNFINHKIGEENLILVVDDDSDSLFTMTEILNSYGYKTSIARNGLECLKVLESIKPKIILLDIMMPEMDGFETLKNIRAKKNFNDIKVFAVTAKAMENARDIIKNSGFEDCIFKPISSLELLQKISVHLNKSLIYEEKSTNN